MKIYRQILFLATAFVSVACTRAGKTKCDCLIVDRADF